jgi:hypothetical protein
MNFANKIKKVTLLATGEELIYTMHKTTADYSYVKIILPEKMRDKNHYTIEIETEEPEPVFQNFTV